jgi:hypothetical protein
MQTKLHKNVLFLQPSQSTLETEQTEIEQPQEGIDGVSMGWSALSAHVRQQLRYKHHLLLEPSCVNLVLTICSHTSF